MESSKARHKAGGTASKLRRQPVRASSPGTIWVEEDVEDDEAVPAANNITSYEPAPEEERHSVRTYAKRLATFTAKKWMVKLCKSKTANPHKMAEVGWYCTGKDSAKCYACFKDLEGWTPEDNPKAEHEKHCPNCPLIRLKINAASAITLREQIRLDTAIEFQRKRLLCKREWSKVRALHEDERDRLKELIAKAEKRRAAQLVNESETML